VIIANELGGPPVPNVPIYVTGANPTTSLTDGTFTLQFPRNQPGETVRLVVQKKGFEVVNDIQLQLPLPKNPESELLTILLCKEGDREEMARRFFRLKSFAAIELSYKNKIQELVAKNQATKDALAGLAKERDIAKAAAEKTAEELARLTPELTSDLYQQAMSLFLSGQVDEALKLLDDKELQHSMEAVQKRKADIDKEVAKVVKVYLLRAQLLTTLLRFDEAAKAYQTAVEVAPDSYEAQFSLAYFSSELNRFPKALDAYGRALELSRRKEDKAETGKILSNMGFLYFGQNKLAEARRCFKDALEAFGGLAQQKPTLSRAGTARALFNLGLLDQGENRLDEARKDFEQALEIFRWLEQNYPNTYLPQVAHALDKLGALDQDQNRPDEARKAMEEALRIYRDLEQKHPGAHLQEVANTLIDIGGLNYDQQRLGPSEAALTEALVIYP
jgi:tetratricopeptide (TPR) repeat protein